MEPHAWPAAWAFRSGLADIHFNRFLSAPEIKGRVDDYHFLWVPEDQSKKPGENLEAALALSPRNPCYTYYAALNALNLAEEKIREKARETAHSILGTDLEGKAALVVMVTADLSQKVPAGHIIQKIAPLVNGGGGGKPELAEAGGKDSSKLADAIECGYSVVEELLGGNTG